MQPASTGARDSGSGEAADTRDCLACRASGSATFAGVSAWLVYEFQRLPPTSTRVHRAIVLAGSALFASASVWRWRS